MSDSIDTLLDDISNWTALSVGDGSYFETVGYKIAMNGHLMASTKFTGSEYWKIILNELKNAKKQCLHKNTNKFTESILNYKL